VIYYYLKSAFINELPPVSVFISEHPPPEMGGAPPERYLVFKGRAIE
jgi:hypothetical protein